MIRRRRLLLAAAGLLVLAVTAAGAAARVHVAAFTRAIRAAVSVCWPGWITIPGGGTP